MKESISPWHAMKVLLKHCENYDWQGWEYNSGGKTLAAQAWESDFGPHTCVKIQLRGTHLQSQCWEGEDRQIPGAWWTTRLA